MERETKVDGNHVIRWIFVLPAFGVVFLFLSAFFKIIVDVVLIRPIAGHHLQLSFILNHIYSDLFCVAFSIYFSCMLAPSRRIIPALVYFVVIVVTIPKHLELAHNNYYYGSAAWKDPFLIALYIGSGLIAVLLFVVKGYLEKLDAAAKRTANGESYD